MLFRDESGHNEIEIESCIGGGLLVTVCDEWTCRGYELRAEAVKRLYDAIGKELGDG